MFSEQTVTFYSDIYKLVGTLHLPEVPNPPVVIGCHGLLADRHSPKQIALAEACNREGVAYFRFDHRGCGDSEGRFAEVTSLAARVRDLSEAVASMQHHSQVGSLIAVLGSRFGGTVALDYSADHPSTALITYAAPINSTSIHHANIRDNHGEAPRSSLLTDALGFDLTPRLASVRNIFVVHSQGDETVPVWHARKIYELSKDPKKLLVFKGGDHRMSDPDHQAQFKARFIEWIKIKISGMD